MNQSPSATAYILPDKEFRQFQKKIKERNVFEIHKNKGSIKTRILMS
jgi:hypothetical protein